MVDWCDDTGHHFKSQGVLLIWIIVGHGPSVLAVGAGEGWLDSFSLVSHLFLPPPLSGRRPNVD